MQLYEVNGYFLWLLKGVRELIATISRSVSSAFHIGCVLCMYILTLLNSILMFVCLLSCPLSVYGRGLEWVTSSLTLHQTRPPLTLVSCRHRRYCPWVNRRPLGRHCSMVWTFIPACSCSLTSMAVRCYRHRLVRLYQSHSSTKPFARFVSYQYQFNWHILHHCTSSITVLRYMHSLLSKMATQLLDWRGKKYKLKYKCCKYCKQQ